MPALGFKNRFADDVAAGRKRQTIRQVWKRPIEPGNELYLYTGMRTKNCRLLGVAECTHVHPVLIREIRHDCGLTDVEIMLRGWALDGQEKRRFVKDDGFDSAHELARFFDKAYGLPFRGVVICWRLHR